MALPKLQTPTYQLEIPSTRQKVSYRPFLAKEEKILLMASESNDPAANIHAIKQLITNCVIDDINVDQLATFDIEYLFIKIYSKSVSNVVTIQFIDEHDKEHYHSHDIDFDKIEVTHHEDHTDLIKLNDDISIKMKYPSITLGEKAIDSSIEVIIDCIDCIVQGENIFKLQDYSRKEAQEFVESFTKKNLDDVKNFFSTMPSVQYSFEYENTKGEISSREIRGLQSFFT